MLEKPRAFGQWLVFVAALGEVVALGSRTLNSVIAFLGLGLVFRFYYRASTNLEGTPIAGSDYVPFTGLRPAAEVGENGFLEKTTITRPDHRIECIPFGGQSQNGEEHALAAYAGRYPSAP